MAAVTIHSDFGAQENKVFHCFHCFPIYLPWSDGTRCHDLCFLSIEYLPTNKNKWEKKKKTTPVFSLSCFTFIRMLFSSSLLSAIRVVSSAYLRLLIFFPPVLTPACAPSNPAFRMMYSAYKLNKQGDNIQTWCTPFPIWNQSVGPCLLLTVASWPAYRFLRGRSDGLVFLSLSEFSTVYCDPHS